MGSSTATSHPICINIEMERPVGSRAAAVDERSPLGFMHYSPATLRNAGTFAICKLLGPLSWRSLDCGIILLAVHISQIRYGQNLCDQCGYMELKKYYIIKMEGVKCSKEIRNNSIFIVIYKSCLYRHLMYRFFLESRLSSNEKETRHGQMWSAGCIYVKLGWNSCITRWV